MSLLNCDSFTSSVLLRAIKLAEPEMDNRRRALNTKMGMERAKLKDAIGKAPVGYSWIRDQKNRPMITPNLDAPFVLEVLRLMRQGYFLLTQYGSS